MRFLDRVPVRAFHLRVINVLLYIYHSLRTSGFFLHPTIIKHQQLACSHSFKPTLSF
jgi:hypothetical protein